MSSFKYQVINTTNGQILRPKGLELMLLSRVVRALLGQHQQACELSKNDTKDMVFDYFEAAKIALHGIKCEDEDEKTKNLIKAAINTIDSAMDTAKIKVESFDGQLIVMSDFDEMWVFFKEVGITCVDSLTVLENIPSDTNDDPNEAKHCTKVQIIHDGNSWIYNLKAFSGKALETTLFINNLEATSLCQQSMWINALFKMMAIMAQKDLIENNFIEDFKQEPDVLKKAKAVASILGGNYENYLIFVANINSHIPYLGRTNEMQKNSISLIVDDRLRATDDQKREVVKIFLAKPNYH